MTVQFDRRTIVRGSVGMAIGGLAGCLDVRTQPADDTDETDPTDDPSDPEDPTNSRADPGPDTDDPRVETLEIQRFELSATEPDPDGTIEPIPDDTIEPGTTVWACFSISGLTVDQDTGRFEFVARIVPVAPDGTELRPVRETFEGTLEDGASIDDRSFVLPVEIDPREPALGTHELTLNVTDEIERGRDSATVSLRVYDEHLVLLEAFTSTIETETDAVVERLEHREDLLRLVYESAHAFADWEEGTEAERTPFAEEIAAIAGAHAGIVDEGFPADPLRATGTDTDDAAFVFTIDDDTVTAYAADEIDAEEYLESVLGSLRLRED